MKVQKDELLAALADDVGVSISMNMCVDRDDDGDGVMIFGNTVAGHDVKSMVTTYKQGFHARSTIMDMEIPEDCMDDISIMLMSMNTRFLRGHFTIVDDLVAYENFITCYDGDKMKLKDLAKEVMIPTWMIGRYIGDIKERISDIRSLNNGEYVIVEGQ